MTRSIQWSWYGANTLCLSDSHGMIGAEPFHFSLTVPSRPNNLYNENNYSDEYCTANPNTDPKV